MGIKDSGARAAAVKGGVRRRSGDQQIGVELALRVARKLSRQRRRWKGAAGFEE